MTCNRRRCYAGHKNITITITCNQGRKALCRKISAKPSAQPLNMTTQEQNDAAVSSKKNKLMAYFSSYITPTKHLSEKSLRSAKMIAKHLLVRRKWATRLH